MLTTSAPLDSAQIGSFCSELVPGAMPIVVECRPERNAPHNDCFVQVDEHVQKHGGERVLGWALWEMPHTMLEAEFHAVWRRPDDGVLVDLNPRDFNFTHIHFLPDAALTYDGRQRDNVRRALFNDPKLKQFIYLKGRQFSLLNAGNLAGFHGIIDRSVASAKLIKDYNAITKQINVLIPALAKLARSRQ